MKSGFVLALGIAIAGQVIYQLMQKGVSHSAHPVLSLLAFYLLAAVMSLPLFWLYPMQGSLSLELKELNLAVVGVAVSIVLIELGFLLAYRAGGTLQASYVTSAAFTTCALVLIGALAYAERFTLPKAAGLALCLAGIWLLSRPSSTPT
jgi:drug/metabolite transporter (DMT)-like permease